MEKQKENNQMYPLAPKSYEPLVLFNDFCIKNFNMGFMECLEWYIKNNDSRVVDIFVADDNDVLTKLSEWKIK